MSTTIEDKISLFANVLSERIEHEFEEKRSKLIQSCEMELKQIEEEYRQKKEKALEEAIKEANIKKQQLISKSTAEHRLAILKKRQEFVERIIEGAKNKAREFLDTEDYFSFLKNTIQQASRYFEESDEIVYVLTAHDMARFKEQLTNFIKKLRKGGPFKLEQSTDEMIGGVFVKSADGHIQINGTISSNLEDNRQLIGQLLTVCLAREEEDDDKTR